MTEVTPLQQSTPKLGRLVVVGLGLIGGSFAKGLRSKGLFREVVGVDRDAESCRLAWSSAWLTVARRILVAPASAPT
ncbi:hypothetical protein [Pseudomonas aeruginosa]|uniref:hypothetical protein n=1 Tax=Pseudomonas aeruginosa TaxID=287 RepID=UPI0040547E3E